MSGTLYIVATPIGNLQDITLRALTILKEVHMIYAEDTRHSKQLLKHFNIHTPLLSLHDHNETAQADVIIDQLQNQQNVAIISDAGTPLISDPGYHVVKACHALGLKVSPVPGVCAAIAALSVAGLPSDQFIFYGFLASKTGQRQKQLQALKSETRTIIFYETPHRIKEALEDMNAIFDPQRKIVLAREITKQFETIHQASLQAMLDFVVNDLNQQKGEMVLILDKASGPEEREVDKILAILLEELPVNQACHLAAKITGVKKNSLYQKALAHRES